MDNDLLSTDPHELEYLARKHGTSVARVKEVMRSTGLRSREEIGAALDKRAEPWWLPAKRTPTGGTK